MKDLEYNKLLLIAIKASINAGIEILRIYSSNEFDISVKSDDSPLTKADIASNKEIQKLLIKTSIPILSEEEKEIDFQIRKSWPLMWIVDPLDGTKEFIKKNGEFTVNIALIENNRPKMGVIYTPVVDELFFSIPEKGSYKMDNAKEKLSDESISLNRIIELSNKLPLSNKKGRFVAVGSKSHMTKETEDYLSVYRDKYDSIEILSKGSSLKLCLIAEGKADIYPRFAPTMEWDIAAGHAIIKGANGVIINADTKEELNYNKENLLNPWFIAASSKEVISK